MFQGLHSEHFLLVFVLRDKTKTSSSKTNANTLFRYAGHTSCIVRLENANWKICIMESHAALAYCKQVSYKQGGVCFQIQTFDNIILNNF